MAADAPGGDMSLLGAYPAADATPASTPPADSAPPPIPRSDAASASSNSSTFHPSTTSSTGDDTNPAAPTGFEKRAIEKVFSLSRVGLDIVDISARRARTG